MYRAPFSFQASSPFFSFCQRGFRNYPPLEFESSKNLHYLFLLPRRTRFLRRSENFTPFFLRHLFPFPQPKSTPLFPLKFFAQSYRHPPPPPSHLPLMPRLTPFFPRSFFFPSLRVVVKRTALLHTTQPAVLSLEQKIIFPLGSQCFLILPPHSQFSFH